MDRDHLLPDRKPRVGLVVIAYNQAEGLWTTIESAISQTLLCDVSPYIFLHSRYPEVIGAVDRIEAEFDATVFRYGNNRGVAKSWNDGILACLDDDCDIIVVSNDDVRFNLSTIDHIVEAVVNPPDDNVWLVKTDGWHERHGHATGDHGMACFAIRMNALKLVGAFDENFFPAYNEDTDYALRAARAGLKEMVAKGSNLWHLGSAAIYSNPELRHQNNITHSYNDRYWDYKWGCRKDPDDWIRAKKHPFGDVLAHPFFIPFEERSAPYPGHNRIDQQIVRF